MEVIVGVLDQLHAQLERSAVESRTLLDDNARLSALLAEAQRKSSGLEKELESVRLYEAAFMRAVATTNLLVTKHADADCAYLDTTSKLEDQLRRAADAGKAQAGVLSSAVTQARGVAEELAASKAATSANAQRVSTLTAKVQALQSDGFLAEGSLLSLQHRLDESVFSAQQHAERASAAEATAASVQKMHDALQKKHAALLSAIASEASLKRKRDQQPPPSTEGPEPRHRTLSLAAGAPPPPQQTQLQRHGGSAASGGGGASASGGRPPAGKPVGTSAASALGDGGGGGGGARGAAAAAAVDGRKGGSAAGASYPPPPPRGPSRSGGGSGEDAGHGRASSGPRVGGGKAPDDTVIDLSPLDDSPIKALKKPRSRYAAL